MLSGLSSQRVPTPLLEKTDHSLITAGRFLKELQPSRTFRFCRRRHRGHLADEVGRIGVAQLSSAQIDGATWRSQQERVAIPDVGCHSKGAIGARELFDTRYERGPTGVAPLLGISPSGELCYGIAREVAGQLGLLGFPI